MQQCGPVINNPCSSYPDSKCVIYTGPNLTNINSFTNDRLEKILQNINNAVGSSHALITLTGDVTGSGTSTINTTVNWNNGLPTYNTYYTPLTRTLTINGVTYDLSQNRSWTINTNYISSVGNTSSINLNVSVSGQLTAAFASNNISQFTNNSGYITNLSSFTTDDLTQGTTNLYDKTVVLTAGAGITISGTYPNFTITNNSPSTGGTVTSVGLSMPSAFTVSNTPVTTAGILTVIGAGTTSQLIDGTGALQTIPTSLPPSGSAGGDLSGTYPDPTVHRIHGIDMQSGTPSADDVWVYGGSPAKWQHQKLNSGQINETTNLFYTDARARNALSFVAGSGDYNSTTGVITIPTNNNQIANGAGYITGNQTITLSGDVTGSGTTAITTSISNTTVTGKLLTGYISGAGTITSSDSILTAIQKLNGNISGLSSTYFPLTGGTITGTSGSGFFGAISQSSAPSTPSSGFRLFANSSNALSWIGANGYIRTLDGTANTADRNYTLPNASGTIALTSDLPTAANPTATIGLTAVNGSASTFMRSDAAPALSQSIAPTWTGFHTFGRSVTASGGIARGTYFNQSLTAAANSDVLVNLDINSTFTNGAFTGVVNWDLRTSRWANFGTTNNTGIVIGNPIWSGGVPLNSYQIFTATGSQAIHYIGSGPNWLIKFRTSGNLDANNRLTIADTYVAVTNSSLLVGTTTTVSSAAAVINSITQGFLPPRMITTQKNAIASPTSGLLVYDTTLNKLCVYTGSVWETITSI